MSTTETPPKEPNFSAADIGALAHLYRGEMYRSKVWRARLDATTNWAVFTTAIALSITFGEVNAPALPIILVSFLVAVFLLFEARRYRFFDIWRTRVRVMETSFYGPILLGKGIRTDNRWNEILVDDYTGLYFHISFLEACGRRLRRNYSWIFAIHLVSYIGKLVIHPTPLNTLDQLWERAMIGPVPGQVVLALGAIFYVGLFLVGTLTLLRQRAVGRARYVPDGKDPMLILASFTERN